MMTGYDCSCGIGLGGEIGCDLHDPDHGIETRARREGKVGVLMPHPVCNYCRARAEFEVETYANGERIATALVCNLHRWNPRTASVVTSHLERKL